MSEAIDEESILNESIDDVVNAGNEDGIDLNEDQINELLAEQPEHPEEPEQPVPAPEANAEANAEGDKQDDEGIQVDDHHEVHVEEVIVNNVVHEEEVADDNVERVRANAREVQLESDEEIVEEIIRPIEVGKEDENGEVVAVAEVIINGTPSQDNHSRKRMNGISTCSPAHKRARYHHHHPTPYLRARNSAIRIISRIFAHPTDTLTEKDLRFLKKITDSASREALTMATEQLKRTNNELLAAKLELAAAKQKLKSMEVRMAGVTLEVITLSNLLTVPPVGSISVLQSLQHSRKRSESPVVVNVVPQQQLQSQNRIQPPEFQQVAAPTTKFPARKHLRRPENEIRAAPVRQESVNARQQVPANSLSMINRQHAHRTSELSPQIALIPPHRRSSHPQPGVTQRIVEAATAPRPQQILRNNPPQVLPQPLSNVVMLVPRTTNLGHSDPNTSHQFPQNLVDKTVPGSNLITLHLPLIPADLIIQNPVSRAKVPPMFANIRPSPNITVSFSSSAKDVLENYQVCGRVNYEKIDGAENKMLQIFIRMASMSNKGLMARLLRTGAHYDWGHSKELKCNQKSHKFKVKFHQQQQLHPHESVTVMAVIYDALKKETIISIPELLSIVQ
ncbi:unnamed protein product [Caenorhabditis sp. 36 PRJEB53466]|nr:unnamed protein product [Caenorhabditis sp. 36 PRJEB53466]